jgi:hypothetical protein
MIGVGSPVVVQHRHVAAGIDPATFRASTVAAAKVIAAALAQPDFGAFPFL